MNILVVDVGGTHVKLLASGQTVPAKIVSGPTMTAAQMVSEVARLSAEWSYEAVSLGYPGPVVHGAPFKEPANLASGWVGFDYEAAFGRPTRIVNDAAMQALGAYTGGRMLFLGLGTGLGSAMVVDGAVEPMELAHLPYRKNRTYEDYVGLRGLLRRGKKKWRREVLAVVAEFSAALSPESVVLGGGNARLLRTLPPNTRVGTNADAFTGGFRLWEQPGQATAPAALPDSHKDEASARNDRPGATTMNPMEYVRHIDHAALEAAGTNERFSQWLLDHTNGGQYCSVNFIKTPAGGGSPAGMHTHAGDQIFYVLEGTMKVEIEGAQYEAGPGSLVVFPAGVPHRNWNSGQEPTVHLAINAPLPDPNELFARPA